MNNTNNTTNEAETITAKSPNIPANQKAFYEACEAIGIEKERFTYPRIGQETIPMEMLLFLTSLDKTFLDWNLPSVDMDFVWFTFPARSVEEVKAFNKLAKAFSELKWKALKLEPTSDKRFQITLNGKNEKKSKPYWKMASGHFARFHSTGESRRNLPSKVKKHIAILPKSIVSEYKLKISEVEAK